MKKRELLRLPEMKVIPSMLQATRKMKKAERYKGQEIEVPKYKWYYRAKKTKKVLEIDTFTWRDLKNGAMQPRYRVFLHDGKYDTYDNLTDKWRTSTIERLEYYDPDGRPPQECWYGENRVWMLEKERKLIIDYVANGKENPRAAVQYWQDWKKNRTELDQIDEQMALVPELPKDFYEWISKEAMPQYIFYDYARKITEGYCTGCERVVPIQNPKYNEEGKCPHCGRKITYKSRKKGGNIVDWTYVGILQKTKEGYVYRYFEAKKQYRNAEVDFAGCWETIRRTYDKDFRLRNEFEWYRYKQTNMVRWCFKQHSGWKERIWEYKTTLYSRNLKKLVKGTKLQYSGLPEYAKSKETFYVNTFLRNKSEGLEKLIKCGFFKLASSLMNDYRGYLNKGEKRCKKVLGLTGNYYKELTGKNPTYREFEIAREFQEVGISITYKEMQKLAQMDARRNFAIYVRHTTLHKMLRYLTEVLDSNEERIREYHDYLQMAAGLGYRLKDPYILYPKNMEERHAQYVEEQNERDQKVQMAKDKEKEEMFRETLKAKGWKKMELETESLFIRLPENPGEIRKEGQEQHHCVATYIDRMIQGKTCILFLRRKEEPKKAFYTVEVKDGQVIQVRAKYNGPTTEEVEKFMEKFKRNLKKIERMVG